MSSQLTPRALVGGSLTQSWGPTPEIVGLLDGLLELAVTLETARALDLTIASEGVYRADRLIR